jgi:alkylhydroperoxidase/carboxymuconolactone decarboxylase family protein YurZ
MANQGKTRESATDQGTNPWAAALAKLQEWDPAWAAHCEKVTTNSWTEGKLPTKFIALLWVGLNAADAELNPDGVRRHIRAAIAAGATRQEIVFVLKCASLMSVHTSTFAAPILLQEASAGSLDDFGAARKQRLQKIRKGDPAVERMKAIGQWNEAWDCHLFLAPVFTEEYMEMWQELVQEKLFSAKELELLLIAFDVSDVHMADSYAHHHIKKAFQAGATTGEIMQVLKLIAAQRVQKRSLGVMILAEELEGDKAAQHATA